MISKSGQFSKEFIQGSVKQLAQELYTHFEKIRIHRQVDLVFVGIMNGALYFLSDLTKYYYELDTNFTSTQLNPNTNSRVPIEDLKKFEGKDIVLVDTIIDSGTTIKVLLELLGDQSTKNLPFSVVTCCLFVRGKCTLTPNFYGCILNTDKYLVGYGLDFNNKDRGAQNVYSAM